MAALAQLAPPLTLGQTLHANTTVVDDIWQDPQRQRALPVRLRWPDAASPVPEGGRPVIVYSHGLGGSRAGAQVWGDAWAQAGFVVLHLQHPGSDLEAARQLARGGQGRAGLRSLASAEQLRARLDDVTFALDDIARRKTIDKAWANVRADGAGMAGHSMGAHTTLGVGGQAYPGTPSRAEARVAALVALSPALPARGDAQLAFAAVKRPVLCLSGTLDDDVLGNGATPARRAGVFAALPAGHKAMLLLEDADHMTFGGTDRQGPAVFAAQPRSAATLAAQPAHRQRVAAITTDWWRAHLLGDAAAQARLALPPGLGAGDVWRTA